LARQHEGTGTDLAQSQTGLPSDWRASRHARKLEYVKEVASYALAIVGVGIIVGAIVRALAANLNYASGKLMLINLLRTNPNRAQDVCKTMSGSFFEAVGEALATGALMRSQDPKVITAATVASFDATGKAVVAKTKQLLTGAKMGLGAAAGGLIIQMSGGKYPPLLIIAAVLCGGGYVFLMMRQVEIERTIVLARRDLLPEIDRAFIDGRYVLPPLPTG
jgi:hypothetical protein